MKPWLGGRSARAAARAADRRSASGSDKPERLLGSASSPGTASVPSVVETVRTRLASSSSVRLGVAGGGVEVVRHVVATDGSLVVVVGDESPFVRQLATERRASVPVQLRAVDVAPVALPERVRATVVMAGRLGLFAGEMAEDVLEYLSGPGGGWSGRPVLRLEPRRVVAILTGPDGPGEPIEVDLAAYRDARTDPLVSIEAEWIQHAQAHHADELAMLVQAQVGTVRPVSLDRFGVALRHDHSGRHERVPFEMPLECPCELPGAIDALVHRRSQGFP